MALEDQKKARGTNFDGAFYGGIRVVEAGLSSSSILPFLPRFKAGTKGAEIRQHPVEHTPR